MQEYPEPDGCLNEPGFVKANPLNNKSYIEKCIANYDGWADILRETDAALEKLIPGYNVAQIKTKFGGLRYYIDYPGDLGMGGFDDETIVAVEEVIENAEKDFYNL